MIFFVAYSQDQLSHQNLILGTKSHFIKHSQLWYNFRNKGYQMALAMLKMQQGMGLIEECVTTAINSFPKGDIVRLQAVVNLVTKIGEKLIETGSISH